MNFNIGIFWFLKLIYSYAILRSLQGCKVSQAEMKFKMHRISQLWISEILWKLFSNRPTNTRYKKLTPFSSVSGDRISWVGGLVCPFRVCFVEDIPSANPLTALSTGLTSPCLPAADDILSLLVLAAPRKSINSFLSCCLVYLCWVAFFMAC